MTRKLGYIASALAVFIVVASIDFITTSSIKVTVFYFVPIYLLVYPLGSTFGGVLLSIASAGVEIAIQLSEGASMGISLVANAVVRFISYLAIVGLVAALRSRNEAVASSLRAKELIIHDIHHRMKNQLAQMLSLLNLGSDEPSEANLEMASRLQAYLQLYNSLCYDSDSQSAVRMDGYMGALAKNIAEAQRGSDDGVRIELSGFDFELDNKAAINIALIVNELITNSFKYAFDETGKGRIVVRGALDGNLLTLDYSDGGPGFDPTPELTMSSTGMIIIHSLVEQLHGSIRYDKDAGSRYDIRLRIP